MDSLDALPATVDPATQAEVRRLGRRVLHVLDPQVAKEEDRKALEAEEAKAYDRARLSLTPLGDGRTRIAGEVPQATARAARGPGRWCR